MLSWAVRVGGGVVRKAAQRPVGYMSGFRCQYRITLSSAGPGAGSGAHRELPGWGEVKELRAGRVGGSRLAAQPNKQSRIALAMPSRHDTSWLCSQTWSCSCCALAPKNWSTCSNRGQSRGAVHRIRTGRPAGAAVNVNVISHLQAAGPGRACLLAQQRTRPARRLKSSNPPPTPPP